MFIMEDKPKSIEAEAYRSLRTNIEYSSFDEKFKRIVITSSVPGEGKSTTTGNLALAFAQDSKKVLVIDCDMRKPTIHKKFNVSNYLGLSEIILGKEKYDVVYQEYTDNLHLITAGNIPPNPSEMLASNIMSDFLDNMDKIYDIIILDSPPLAAVTDAQVLATKSDGVLLVVKANDTKKEVITRSIDAIKKVNGKVIGTVLNGVEASENHYYYYGEDGDKKKKSKKKFFGLF